MKAIQISLYCLLLSLKVAATPVITFTEAEFLSPTIIRIPFTLSGTLPMVRARVDAKTGNFFFDTGASELLLNGRVFEPKIKDGSQAGGVSGKVTILGSTKIDTFLCENLLITKAVAKVVDLRHLESVKQISVFGILGFTVFDGYEVLFDYQDQLIILIKLDSKGIPIEPLPTWQYVPLDTIEIERKGHVAMIPLTFNSKTKWFGLDSGAEQNMIDSRSARKFLEANFQVIRRIKMSGMGQDQVEVFAGVLLNSKLDTLTLAPMPTLLTNMAQINEIYQTNLDGIIGYQFLVQQPMSINYKRRTLIRYRQADKP